MDRPRDGIAGRRRRTRLLVSAAVVAGIALVALSVARLEPASPVVDRATLWIGQVERGALQRTVRGTGTLVPESLRWVPAPASGRVERVLVPPGGEVGPEDLLLVLSNPEVEQRALDAASELGRAEAELAAVRARLRADELTQASSLAAIEAEAVGAELRAEADGELARKGLISTINLRVSEVTATTAARRRQLESERLEALREVNRAQLEAKRAEVEQKRSVAALRARQRDDLHVRAGLGGVVQQVPVRVGEQVEPGRELALVAEPTRLKAELRIPATQARDVALGQPCTVDTRNGTVVGEVARIDPAVRESTVTVDVRFAAPLPRGARPEMVVEGTVNLDRIEDALVLGRPAAAAENGTITLFRLRPDRQRADRVEVRLGRLSADAVEVLSGLEAGDRVILSDTMGFNQASTIRVK